MIGLLVNVLNLGALATVLPSLALVNSEPNTNSFTDNVRHAHKGGCIVAQVAYAVRNACEARHQLS